MSRTHLLGAASAVALSCAALGAQAASVVNGGGSTLAQFVYGNGAPYTTPTPNEFNLWNTQVPAPAATFGSYWESGSGAGQLGFLTDNLTCVIEKSQGASTICTGTPGGANTQHYGASDATLTTTQTSSWATLTVGQSLSGNLIQLPTIGVGVAIPVKNAALTKNGALVFTDNDLCGIFSGKITNFSQITDSPVAPTAGAITVVYRADGSGTTFLLTNHLSDPNVCNSSNTNSGFTFVPTLTFASLFGGTPPANFHGENGSSGIADALSGLGDLGTNPKNIVTYLTPDLTTIAPKSTATLSNGTHSKLKVVAVTSGAVTAALPLVGNIILGLKSVIDGTNKTPPTNATAGANPLNWVPTVATVSAGYPIVGYTTADFAQCYADPNVAAAVKGWLTDNYKNTAYQSVEKNNGFVPLVSSKAAPFYTYIANHILSNSTLNGGPWNTDIENTKVCKAVGGSTYAGR